MNKWSVKDFAILSGVLFAVGKGILYFLLIIALIKYIFFP